MTELGNKLTRASGGPLTPLALPQRCIPLLSPSRPHWGHWIAKLLSIAKPSHLFLPPLHWITSRAFWLLGSVASNLVSITFHIPRVFWSKGISSTYHYQLVNSPTLSDFHSDGLSLHCLGRSTYVSFSPSLGTSSPVSKDEQMATPVRWISSSCR